MIPIFGTRVNEVVFYTVFSVFYGVDFILTYGVPLVRRRLRKKRDRTFTILLLSLFLTAYFSFFFGYFSYYTGIGELPLPFLYVGLALIVIGESFRIWAILTLDRYFSPIITIYSDHKVVTWGPYRLVRHPAYGGSIISFLGIALASRSVFSLLLVLIDVAVYDYRAKAEEKLLIESLGDEYVNYRSRVRKKFIPFIF